MTLNIGSVYLEIYLAKVQIEWPTGPLSTLTLTKDSQHEAELNSNKPAASSKSFLVRHHLLSPPRCSGDIDVHNVSTMYKIIGSKDIVNSDNDEDNSNGGDNVNDDDADDDADGDYDDYMMMMSIMVFCLQF